MKKRFPPKSKSQQPKSSFPKQQGGFSQARPSKPYPQKEKEAEILLSLE